MDETICFDAYLSETSDRICLTLPCPLWHTFITFLVEELEQFSIECQKYSNLRLLWFC